MPLRNEALQRLRRRSVPTWWRDAKLGIFVHWTPASVPAFAPFDDDIAELMRTGRPDAFAWSPYSEWYENSLRFPQSPASAHHREVYGDRPYAEFIPDWEAGLEQWDPGEWATTFAATGARYVVLVTKHHDGYCLWPTDVPNPNRPGWHCPRDVVGELADAVRAAGLRFGVYYSGGLDSTFEPQPVGSMATLLAAIPRGDYPDYAEAQVRELIERYRPSVLWNDIAWPTEPARLWSLFEDYYDAVPDGVVNDRWMPWNALLGVTRTNLGRRVVDAGARRQATKDEGIVPPKPPYFDVRTPEYVVFPEIQRTPWECVRGMDQSFGYNAQSREEHFLAHDDLLWSLTDIVAKGGNLLLNVGPRGVDAQIPDEQRTRLEWLAEWVGPNADAIAATRPWVVAGNATGEGRPLRYTAVGDTVFAFVQDPSGSVTLPEVRATPTTVVELLDGTALAWKDSAHGLVVDGVPPGTPEQPVVVALRKVEARNA